MWLTALKGATGQLDFGNFQNDMLSLLFIHLHIYIQASPSNINEL